jgi:hypothetical protein
MAVTGTKKFHALVQDFVSTAAELGYTADRAAIAAELEALITAVATQLHVTEETALRTYLDDDWGRDMARDFCNQIAERSALVEAEPARELTVQAASRLVAALGQALLCYAINEGGGAGQSGDFSANDASQAVSGLGLALHATQAGAATVSVGGDVAVWAREALTAFGDNLRQGRWTSCPCGDRHEDEDMDTRLLRAAQHRAGGPPPPGPGDANNRVRGRGRAANSDCPPPSAAVDSQPGRTT